MATKELRVVRIGENHGEVVRTINVSGKSDRQVEKIEMGLLRQMDLDKFSVDRVDDDAQEAT